jgi:uncharacterized OB-fold protein
MTPGSLPGLTDASTPPPYVRAVDPLPLESAEFNKLHEFYTALAEGRLTTTRCRACGRIDWPPRGFCPACTADAYDWVDLPAEGRIHGFTIQEAGVPAGYPRPLVFAMVEVAGLRIFAPLVGVSDPARIVTGAEVRFTPLRVADDPKGHPRYLPAFTPVESGRG